MYNLIELFSGIGSQYAALKNIGMEIEVKATCEWDIHAFVAYDAIHNSPELPFDILKMTKEELLIKLSEYNLSNDGKNPMEYESLKAFSVAALRRIFAAIIRSKNYVDISRVNGRDLPKHIDIMTYSFPCQDLSNVGAFHGYNLGIDKDSGSRSSLLWEVGRIISEMRNSRIKPPRFLLMENVPSLLSERHRGNFKMWREELSELGYESYYYQLNASSFGLPQNRPRLLMISAYVSKNQALRNKVKRFLKKHPEDVVWDYQHSPYYRDIKPEELYRIDYSNPVLFQEAVECTPNDTPSRRKIWEENPQLVLEGNHINTEYDIIRTITTKQDRNPNSGNLYFDSGIDGRSLFRYLTPRECFLFMGFTDADYENVVKNNPEIRKGTEFFSRDKIIRMAGNSIPVKLLEGLFLQIRMLDEEAFGNNGCT